MVLTICCSNGGVVSIYLADCLYEILIPQLQLRSEFEVPHYSNVIFFGVVAEESDIGVLTESLDSYGIEDEVLLKMEDFYPNAPSHLINEFQLF